MTYPDFLSRASQGAASDLVQLRRRFNNTAFEQDIKNLLVALRSATYTEPRGSIPGYRDNDREIIGTGWFEAEDRLGGAYKDVPDRGGQVHHMPAKSISPLSEDDGPGIRMSIEDHRRTASWGR